MSGAVDVCPAPVPPRIRSRFAKLQSHQGRPPPQRAQGTSRRRMRRGAVARGTSTCRKTQSSQSCVLLPQERSCSWTRIERYWHKYRGGCSSSAAPASPSPVGPAHSSPCYRHMLAWRMMRCEGRLPHAAAATSNLVMAPLDPDEQLFEWYVKWCMAPALLRGGGHRPWHRHMNHVPCGVPESLVSLRR